MFCYAAAMVILEEVDDHIAGYLFVTVLGKEGYLLARLGIPAAAAFVFTVILLPFFRLHGSGISSIVCLAAGGALQGLILALLIAALSANKLEGMAVTKLSSLTVMGAAVPYFSWKCAVRFLLAALLLDGKTGLSRGIAVYTSHDGHVGLMDMVPGQTVCK